MDSNWFEVTVKYEQVAEDGTNRMTSHHILIDALSYTEAESRAIEEMSPFAGGSLEIANVARRKYVEIFNSTSSNADRYYHASVGYIILDEKSMKEKRVKVLMLIQANTLDDAIKALHDGMRGSMADYEIVMIKESAIEEVYNVNVNDNVN